MGLETNPMQGHDATSTYHPHMGLVRRVGEKGKERERRILNHTCHHLCPLFSLLRLLFFSPSMLTLVSLHALSYVYTRSLDNRLTTPGGQGFCGVSRDTSETE